MLITLAIGNVLAATQPTADKAGSKDSPALKRYEGSFIVAYEKKAFAEFSLPISRLEPVLSKTDGKNNRLHEPRSKKALEGAYTRIVYLIPPDRSPLEVVRNYQDEIKSARWKSPVRVQGSRVRWRS